MALQNSRGLENTQVLVTAAGKIDNKNRILSGAGCAFHNFRQRVRRLKRRNNSFRAGQQPRSLKRFRIRGISIVHPSLLVERGVFGADSRVVEAR